VLDCAAYHGEALQFIDEKLFCHIAGCTIRIADLSSTAKPEFIWSPSPRGFSALACCPKTNLIAAAVKSHPPAVYIYTWPQKQIKHTIRTSAKLEFSFLAFSRSGERLACLSHLVDHQLSVFDMTTPAEPTLLATLALPAPCRAVAFDPMDETFLASAGETGVTLYQLTTSQHQHVLEQQAAADTEAVPFNAEALAIVDRQIEEASIELGDEFDEGQELSHRQQLRQAERACFTALAWGKDHQVYAGNSDGVLACFNASVGGGLSLVKTFSNGFNHGCFQADRAIAGIVVARDHVIVACAGKYLDWICLPELDAVEQSGTIQSLSAGGDLSAPEHIASVAVSPLYSTVVVGTAQGTIHTQPIPLPDDLPVAPVSMPALHTFHRGATLCCATLTVEGSDSPALFATGGQDGSVRLWWTSTGTPAAQYDFRTNVPSHMRDSLPGPDSPLQPRSSLKGPNVGYTSKMRLSSTSSVNSGSQGDLDSLSEAEDRCFAKEVPVMSLCAAENHPVLAVGLSSGQVSLLYVHAHAHSDGIKRDRPAITVMPLALLEAFQGPVTSVAFNTASSALLLTSSKQRQCAVVEINHKRNDFPFIAQAKVPGAGRLISANFVDNQHVSVVSSAGSMALFRVPSDADAGSSSLAEAPELVQVSTVALPVGSAEGGLSGCVIAGAARQVWLTGLQYKSVVAANALPSISGIEDAALSLEKSKECESETAKGISCLSVSRSKNLIATGGVDGLVQIWSLGKSGVSAEPLYTLQCHRAACLSVSFAHDDATVATAAADGSLFFFKFRRAPAPQPPKVVSALLLLARQMGGSEDAPLCAPLPLPVHMCPQGLGPASGQGQGAPGSPIARPGSRHARLRSPGSPSGMPRSLTPAASSPTAPGDSAEFGAQEGGALGSVTVPEDHPCFELMDDISTQLTKLLEDNLRASELERMDRGEFVVDVAREQSTVQTNKERAEEVRQAIKQSDAMKDMMSARLRHDCYESMRVKRIVLFALADHLTAVENFAIVHESAQDTLMFEKLRRLRVLEIREMQAKAGAEATHDHRVWPGRRVCVPSRVSYIVNEGTLSPKPDVIEALKKEEQEAAAGSKKGDKGAAALDDDLENAMGLPTELDLSSILTLLYPPTALKTPNQKRMQMTFLARLIVDMKEAFNQHFDTLHSQKQDELEKIGERNVRIAEILEQLKSEEPCFTPYTNDLEQPETVLKVLDTEMTCKPYETEAMKQAREAVEAEKRRKEAESQKDNVGERALIDMMNGTLEVKKEGALEVEMEPMPDWMQEVQQEEMNEEQRAEYDAYQDKLKAWEEAREKERKALELELKKLRTEVTDLVKAFDEKVEELAGLRIRVQLAISTQEMYILRLRMGLMEGEDELLAIARLDNTMRGVLELKASLDTQSTQWQAEVDRAKDDLAGLQETDKKLEKDFRREIGEASPEPINQDTMKILTQLYKIRHATKDADMNSTAPGSRMSANRSSNGGRGSLRRSSVVQNSSRRSAQDNPGSMLGGGRRSSRMSGERLSTDNSHGAGPLQEALNQAKRMKAAEHDPFVDLETKPNRCEKDAVAEVTPLSMDRDCPDGFRVDDSVWDKLQELRSRKIRSEHAVKTHAVKVNEMKKEAEGLSHKQKSLERDLQALRGEIQMLEDKVHLNDRNLEILVLLKQEQNEMQQDRLVTDYHRGILLPVGRLEQLNDEIKSLGDDKVKTLTKIKNFRKSINYTQWEHRYMGKQLKNLEEYHTDLLLLRVEKRTLEIMKGGSRESDAQMHARTDKKTEIIQRVHQDKLAKLKKSIAKMASSIQDRRSENEKLVAQMAELEGSVKVRESIYQSRVDATGGHSNPAHQAASRMKKVTMRRRLVDLARVQTEEIDYLRQELDRLRQRTFPSFANAARSRLMVPPDEVL